MPRSAAAVLLLLCALCGLQRPAAPEEAPGGGGNDTLGPGAGPWEVATPESQGLSTAALWEAEEAIERAVGGRVRAGGGAAKATQTPLTAHAVWRFGEPL
jgi:hypothetical protein